MSAPADEPLAFLLRTRSTTIIGFAELLGDDRILLAPEQRARYVEIVLSELDALERDVRRHLGRPAPPAAH